MTLVGGGGEEEMEKDFDSKLRLQENAGNSRMQRSKSITFRAPQEHFTVQDFDLGKIYGVGSYSKVVRAKKKDTGNVYALKIMDKKFITKENKISYVKLERIVLDQLDHPGIIRLFFTFQDNYSLYMALESCEGGELFDQITRKGRLLESEACFYAAEIIDVLEYIHGIGLIHRDIKPENLLLTADGHIKIADFGSVKPMKDSQINVLQAATNEKACTFVGTAAYVPPEVLNSSPATFGNDLWALGCTLYQMLSGTSPFKDASEWLIFQRIIARDLKFPDYFSDEARDLIDKLLDIDPSNRPGAGPDGYFALKRHPFFKGVDWKNLRAQSAPKLALELNAAEDDAQDAEWNLSHVGDVSTLQNSAQDGSSGATSSTEACTHMNRAIDDSSGRNISNMSPPRTPVDSFMKMSMPMEKKKDDEFQSYHGQIFSFPDLQEKQEFLDPGESVVMISMVKKIQKLANKKVQLILTDKPKLIYVDPSKMMIKGHIIWSDNPNDLSIQVVNSSLFKICTPKKVIAFEDSKQRAWQWKKAIEGLQNR